MAASAMLAVGNVNPIIEQICVEARKVVPGVNLGAVISKDAKTRIENYISEAEKSGAKILVDGRGVTVEGKENGTYVGPTVIDVPLIIAPRSDDESERAEDAESRAEGRAEGQVEGRPAGPCGRRRSARDGPGALRRNEARA